MENGFEEGRKEGGRMKSGCCSGLEGGGSGLSQGNGSCEEVDKYFFFNYFLFYFKYTGVLPICVSV